MENWINLVNTLFDMKITSRSEDKVLAINDPKNHLSQMLHLQ